MHTTAEEGRIKSLQNGNDTLNGIINGMDSRHDKQRFLEYNHSAFMVPKKFEFQGQKDEVREARRERKSSFIIFNVRTIRMPINDVRANLLFRSYKWYNVYYHR